MRHLRRPVAVFEEGAGGRRAAVAAGASPSSERARIGHTRENDEGTAIDDPARNDKDQWHKAELLFAVTRFEGLAGFRDPEKSAQMLRLLTVPWAEQTAARLETGPAFETLGGIVTATLALEGRKLSRILHEVGDAARHAGARATREVGRHRSHRRGDASINARAARVFTRVGALVTTYPRDPGVLFTLLLNNVLLAPGEAMFFNAGVVHAYLEGFGIETMASFDNVLRAGLTPRTWTSRSCSRSPTSPRSPRRAGSWPSKPATSLPRAAGLGVQSHRRPLPLFAACLPPARAACWCSRGRARSSLKPPA